MDDRTGQDIRSYNLVELIGTGGFGQVYRAHQDIVKREVAIKVILPKFANHPEFIRSFETEAQLVASLEHPYIVPLYDFWREPDSAFLVMRWLRGGTLRSSLSARAWSVPEVLRLIIQISSALSAAHRRGVIHRDIKPDNILLDEDNNAYLTDFGIATNLANSKQPRVEINGRKAIIGSPEYMAPEQILNEPITPQTDIYSLGIVLYQIFTGKTPFKGDSPQEVLRQHVQDPMPSLQAYRADLPNGLNKIIWKATAKHATARYEDVTLMAEELYSVIKDHTQTEMPVMSAVIDTSTRSLPTEPKGIDEDDYSPHPVPDPREDDYGTIPLSDVHEVEDDVHGTIPIPTGDLPRQEPEITEAESELDQRSDEDQYGTYPISAPGNEFDTNVLPMRKYEDSVPSLGFGEDPLEIDLEELFNTNVIAMRSAPAPNPYKGLRAFEESDARDFFGREEFIDTFLSRIATQIEEDETRFLAVVGPSGSGKSSFVRAGVMPALRDGRLEDSHNWFLLTITPNSNPYVELGSALNSVALDAFINIEKELRSSVDSLHNVAEMIMSHPDDRIVLFIDQFEEVFTLVNDEQLRAEFLATLHHAVTVSGGRIRVIVSLRADFYDRPLLYPDFGALVQRFTEVVLPLSAQELERAIIGPAERADLEIEPGLVSAVVSDLNQQPGALPLLQYALMELYERRDDKTMTVDAYNEIGGVLGALAKRAEEIYQLRSPEQQAVARQLFLRLVVIGEGTNAEATRRRADWEELINVGDDRALMEDVINTFSQYRLLTLDRDPITRAPTVQLAHESLIRVWQRLREWIADNRGDLRLRQQLNIAAKEWQNSGNDRSFMATGARLVQFEELQTRADVALGNLEKQYVEQSVTLRQRRLYRRQAFIASLVILTLLALTSAVFAFDQRGQAESERDRANLQEQLARARELSVTSLMNAPAPDLSLLLSLEALKTANIFESQSSLLTALQANPRLETFLRHHSEPVRQVALHPNGETMATADEGGTVILWDTATFTPLQPPFIAQLSRINALVYSLDGSLLATSGNDGVINLLSAETGEQINDELLQHGEAVWSLAFNPAGDRIISGGLDGIARFWDVNTGQVLRETLIHDDAVYGILYTPDGETIITASADARVHFWDAETLEELDSNVTSEGGWILDIALNPTGDMLAFVGQDQSVTLVDVNSREIVSRFGSDHTDWIRSVVFSPDSQLLLTAGDDGIVEVFDVARGRQVSQPLTAHTDSVWDLIFTSSGEQLITVGEDAQVILWDMSAQPGLIVDRSPLIEPSLSVDYSPDGRLIAFAGGDPFRIESPNVVQLWDTQAGEFVGELSEHIGPVTQVAFSPDGSRIATSGADNAIYLWDTESQTVIGEALFGHNGVVNTLAFHPDGARLISGGQDGALVLWDVESGNGDIFAEDYPPVLKVVITPDGDDLLSAHDDGTVYIWSMSEQEIEPREISTNHTDVISSIAISPDGTTLATASRDRTLRLWDIATGQVIGEPLQAHNDWVQSVAFNPDGEWLASGGRDRQMFLWNVEARQPLGNAFTGYQGWVNGLAFSPDGTTLATADSNGEMLIYDVDLESWQQRACAISNRVLTEDEWNRFLRDMDYAPACWTIE